MNFDANANDFRLWNQPRLDILDRRQYHTKQSPS
jgi:hypothetical protein